MDGGGVPDIETLPGYRRRFLVTPTHGAVRTDLEDDYHCMSVIITHENGIATNVEGIMHRAPWSTCPGAQAVLQQTFTGVRLEDFPARGEKTSNCTHLHDLATLAAAHAHDTTPLVYDVLTSDPIEGEIRTELRRNGETLHAWTLAGDRITEPASLAGMTLFKIQPLLESLDKVGKEAVRVLRWGSIIAHGRYIPIEQQSDASKIPPNCYTFQPETASRAKRVGVIREFSTGTARPLDGG